MSSLFTDLSIAAQKAEISRDEQWSEQITLRGEECAKEILEQYANFLKNDKKTQPKEIYDVWVRRCNISGANLWKIQPWQEQLFLSTIKDKIDKNDCCIIGGLRLSEGEYFEVYVEGKILSKELNKTYKGPREYYDRKAY